MIYPFPFSDFPGVADSQAAISLCGHSLAFDLLPTDLASEPQIALWAWSHLLSFSPLLGYASSHVGATSLSLSLSHTHSFTHWRRSRFLLLQTATFSTPSQERPQSLYNLTAGPVSTRFTYVCSEITSPRDSNMSDHLSCRRGIVLHRTGFYLVAGNSTHPLQTY